jgi:Protein of unknown function (DUF3306)
MTDSLNGRFARWSQRKAAARRGGALPAQPEDAAARIHSGDGGQPLSREQQDAALAVPDTGKNAEATSAVGEDIPVLPPIEELTFQSDYTVFMAKNVPEALRRAALRKLWVSDPVLANLDGLNDYCEDFNLVDTPITLAQTSYRVGKGYLDEIEEKLAQLDDAGADGKPTETQVDPVVRDDAGNAASADSEAASGDTDVEPASEAIAAPRQIATLEPDNGIAETKED